MQPDLITCPICKGQRGGNAHHNTGLDSTGHYWAWVQCRMCNGMGTITQQDQLRISNGLLLRAERMKNRVSLLEAAREKGISPAELSRIECGFPTV